MEKKRKQSWFRRLLKPAVLCLLGAALLVHADVGVRAAEPAGEIHLVLRDLKASGSVKEGVKVSLYQVGTVSEHGKPEFYDRYPLGDYPQDGEALDHAAEQLTGLLNTPGGEESPLAEGETDAAGELRFQRLEQGIYLVKVEEKNPYGNVKPFLVNLPYYEELGGKLEGPVYQVRTEPKASPYPAPEKPKHDDDDEDGEHGETPPEPSPGSVPNPLQSPRTGDETEILGWILGALAGAAGLTAVAVMRRKRRRRS